jgi:hypothetical protein
MRFPRIFIVTPLVAGMICTALPVRAQTTPPSVSAGDTSSLPTAPPKPKKDRPVSTGLAATLAASMPKYNPPPKPVPEDEDVDLREVDKPRNGIIRLPKYTVQEKKPPVFRERDIFTTGGLAELARNRYLTATDRILNRVTLPLFGTSQEARAMAMYAEDERLHNMSDLKDTAKDVGRTNSAEGAYIKRVTDETYMRNSGFGYQSGPK